MVLILIIILMLTPIPTLRLRLRPNQDKAENDFEDMKEELMDLKDNAYELKVQLKQTSCALVQSECCRTSTKGKGHVKGDDKGKGDMVLTSVTVTGDTGDWPVCGGGWLNKATPLVAMIIAGDMEAAKVYAGQLAEHPTMEPLLSKYSDKVLLGDGKGNVKGKGNDKPNGHGHA